jgi:hypothetical protein
MDRVFGGQRLQRLDLDLAQVGAIASVAYTNSAGIGRYSSRGRPVRSGTTTSPQAASMAAG